MADSKTNVVIRYAKKSDQVSLSIAGVAHSFDAAGLDKLLTGLGKARAMMKSKVPADLEDGSVVVVRDPTWRTMSTPLTADPLLHLRDSRFGWLHYALPRDSARTLAVALTKLADAPAPTPDQTQQ
jgi:hypothetical protein